MPRTVHPPEWPDKVMFAAMLQVMGGALGALFALLQMSVLQLDKDVARHLGIVPPWLALVLSLATVALGIYAIRHQASVWVWISVATAIASFGMVGLSPFLALVAVAFLLRSRAEGEETVHDARTMHASRWPDKALAASLLLFVGGMVSLAQAYIIAQDLVLIPEMLRDVPIALAGLSALAGLWSVFASFEVYRLRRAWAGYVSVGLTFLSLGFLLIGPAIAVATLTLLRRAAAENEFRETPATA